MLYGHAGMPLRIGFVIDLVRARDAASAICALDVFPFQIHLRGDVCNGKADMPIPRPNSRGFLDPSTLPYKGTLEELHERFVVESPSHQEERALIFRALLLHLELLVAVGGPGAVWVDGGFITYKDVAPHDIDLVYLCRDESHMGMMLRSPEIYSLLTIADVIMDFPVAGGLRRLQPVGGLVDAFLTLPEGQMYWAAQWAKIKGPDGNRVPGTRKGFVEVSL
jgi:hypothetical protein